MISLRLSPALKLMVALAALAVVGIGAASAQLDRNVDAVRMRGPSVNDQSTDMWEPNDSSGSIAIGPGIPAGYVPKGNFMGAHISSYDVLGNIFRGQNGAANPFQACTNDPVWLTQGDIDWWELFRVPSGTLHVAVHQINDLANPLAVEVYLGVAGGSPTLVAGPLMPVPFYRELRKSNNPPDPYDGVVMDIPIAGAYDEYHIKVFEKGGAGSFTPGAKVLYELSYECGWGSSNQHPNGSGLDPLEGAQPDAPLNNFFLESAADVTPALGDQTFNMTYNGYDYYKVVLTSPASISLNLTYAGATTGPCDMSTANPQPNIRFNYDLYWVAGGGNYGFIPNPMRQDTIEFEGATDQWSSLSGSWLRCGNPDPFPTINTPTLAAGTYYFLVVCWDTGIPTGTGAATIDGVFNSGNNRIAQWPQCGADPCDYSLRVITTPDSDDQYDISPNNNDTAAAASALLPGVYGGLRMFWGPTSDEQDWFKVSLNDGDTLEVRLDVAPQAGLCDDFTLELYSPPGIGAQAGAPQSMIDRSAADQRGDRRLPYKNASGQSSGWTTYETVGTWGTVGLVGNTRGIAGNYYIRVQLGPEGNVYDDVIATQGTYSLTIFVNGFASGVPQLLPPIVVAPEDNKESNDNYQEARNNANAAGVDGLTRNSKAMDFQDWYKVPAGKNDNIQATLVYTAVAPNGNDAGVDLDVLIYDMDQDIPVGTAPNIVQVPVCPIVGANIDIETPGQQRVTVSATAGLGYNPGPTVNGMVTTAPNNGNMYIVVQRWGCRAAAYDLNININGRSPITGLQLTAVRVGTAVEPGTVIDAGLNQYVDIEVDVTNVLSSAESVTAMSFNLIHEKGADVTGQYAITGPLTGPNNPTGNTLPCLVLPGAANFKTFVFRVQGNPLSTNGSVNIYPDAVAGNKQVPGLATDDFTTVNGNPPGPKFVYTILRAAPGSNLKPGGALVLEVVVTNAEGTTAGMLTEPASIVFSHNGLDISTEYTRSTNSPVVGGVANGMPVMLTVGQDVSCEWFYGISSGATSGDVTVTFQGGGTANPETSSGAFVIADGYGGSFLGGGAGGCAQAAGFTAPWLLIAGLFVVAVVAQRKRRDAADKA